MLSSSPYLASLATQKEWKVLSKTEGTDKSENNLTTQHAKIPLHTHWVKNIVKVLFPSKLKALFGLQLIAVLSVTTQCSVLVNKYFL